MTRLSEEDLRRSTLRRQFPDLTGHDDAAVVALFDRIGPVQSQVPRAPFLAASSRLPGVAYDTITALFESHRLLKSSNLRGTVHTSTWAQFGWLDVVARRARLPVLARQLGLTGVTPEQVVAVVEEFTEPQWRSRVEILAHVRDWLARHDPEARIDSALTENLVWGHSALLRRPPDQRWERRTDIHRRLASSLVPAPPRPDFAVALTELVRGHLRAYGPVGRDDLAFFFGVGLGAVDAAVRSLGDEMVHRAGTDGEDYLDLADPPAGGDPDPGLRLLGEFDGLLLGFHGRHRDRFLTAEQLPKVWAKTNGLLCPVVLHDARLVAGWRTTVLKGRTVIDVAMLPPYPPLAEDDFVDAVAATERVLGLTVAEVRIAPA